MKTVWNAAHPGGNDIAQDATDVGIGDNQFILAMLLVAWPLVFIIFKFVWGIQRSLYHTISYQIPSPIQIGQQLRIELGREPSLMEVEAVHTMLTNQHNQELLRTGVGMAAIAGLYELNKH